MKVEFLLCVGGGEVVVVVVCMWMGGCSFLFQVYFSDSVILPGVCTTYHWHKPFAMQQDGRDSSWINATALCGDNDCDSNDRVELRNTLSFDAFSPTPSHSNFLTVLTNRKTPADSWRTVPAVPTSPTLRDPSVTPLLAPPQDLSSRQEG